MLRFIDFDGFKIRFSVIYGFGILIIMPDGICVLESSENVNCDYVMTFKSIDIAMKHITDMVTLYCLRRDKEEEND